MKHGFARREKRPKIYAVWQTMLARCYRKSNDSYSRYGGRGIKVCKEWHEFVNFMGDMYEGYLEHEKTHPNNTSLDRIDTYGDYAPGNCRWATRSEQQNNRLDNQELFVGRRIKDKLVAIGRNQKHFAERYGINQWGISACLSKRQKTHKGWKFRLLR